MFYLYVEYIQVMSCIEAMQLVFLRFEFALAFILTAARRCRPVSVVAASLTGWRFTPALRPGVGRFG